MHSSISDRLPSVNATVQMARLIDRMDRELLGRLRRPPGAADSPTVNVGVTARGGRLLRRLPGRGRVRLRHPHAARDDPRALVEDLERFLARRGRRRPGSSTPSSTSSSGFRRPRSTRRTGSSRRCARRAGSCSATSVPSASSPARPTRPTSSSPPASRRSPRSGPGFLPRAHAPNESAPVEGILQAAELYALAARRYVEGGMTVVDAHAHVFAAVSERFPRDVHDAVPGRGRRRTAEELLAEMERAGVDRAVLVPLVAPRRVRPRLPGALPGPVRRGRRAGGRARSTWTRYRRPPRAARAAGAAPVRARRAGRRPGGGARAPSRCSPSSRATATSCGSTAAGSRWRCSSSCSTSCPS